MRSMSHAPILLTAIPNFDIRFALMLKIDGVLELHTRELTIYKGQRYMTYTLLTRVVSSTCGRHAYSCTH